MSKVQFAVSAKTARLIGRENISDVDGAIIELIKNSYDADAKCVFVKMDVPFPNIPKTISYTLCKSVFDTNEISYLLCFYTDTGVQLEKNKNLTAEEELTLSTFLSSKNSIVIMDNGSGMTEYILQNTWMNIGTNDKEERRISPGGRVKTGAKGIGRFALDKLSTATTVVTKNLDDGLKTWHIDWNQFETATLLEEVSATIEDCEGTFFDWAKNVSRDCFKAFENYEWETGTIIKLSPTRETWSESYFQKVNKNLKSLFPSTNSSQFDIFVFNTYYPKYSFANERFTLDNSEFDYKIIGSFDGKDVITVEISRNEIDTRKLKTTIDLGETQMEVSLSEFWNREAFKEPKYIRSSFAKKVKHTHSAKETIKRDPSSLESVGPFSVELYFLKNASSPIGIVKPVVSNRRKEILKNFSGIKLYRDGFKVRPYGEQDGPSFDWLSLGLRAQKSPAAVSHNNGSWRVRSNQIIGEVRITKDENPNLSDMANREGLAVNDSYAAFKDIIEKMLEIFEADRQYIFREYAEWIKGKTTAQSKTAEIVEAAKVNESKKKTDQKTTDNYGDSASVAENSSFSQGEYEKTILDLEEQRQKQERATKTMMLYSSSGVMTNTFSHEISRIMSQAGSRMQHMRRIVNRILGNNEYTGHPSYNPYTLIDQVEKVDQLLENWLEVIVSGNDSEVFSKKNLNLVNVLEKYVSTWKPLLHKKLIDVLPIKVEGDPNECVCNLAEIDLMIIINNFMLNSAHFLEKFKSGDRIITIAVQNKPDRVVLEMENNGPQLDGEFATNPNRIFEAGVSTRIDEDGQKGSGIGLWIVKTIVSDNSGTVHPMVKEQGFGLRIVLPK